MGSYGTEFGPDNFNSASVDVLAEWMLNGMQFNFVYWSEKEETTPSIQLQYVIDNLPPETASKMLEAITMAIDNWTPKKHNLETLHSLAYTTGLTRNIDALPSLIRTVDEKLIEEEDKDLKDTRAMIIAVVQGFAPDAQAKDAFERWWADPGFDWRHTGQLFMGLVACNPNDIEIYLQDFFQRIAKHLDYFVRLDFVTSELTSFVSVDALEEILTRYDNEIARQMLTFIPVARKILAETHE